MTDNPLAAFDAATQKVTEERGEIYGHPDEDFGRIMEISKVLDECTDVRIRHVLRMIAVKMCRLIVSPGHLDSWIDIAGYARTAVMILQRRAESGAAANPPNHWFLKAESPQDLLDRYNEYLDGGPR